MVASIPPWPSVSAASDGLTASLDDAGNTTSIGPVAAAAGSAPPAFDSKAALAQLHRTISLNPNSPLRPTLRVDAQAIADQAQSAGFGVDAISASATSSIASLDLLLTDNPLSALGVLGLAVSATFIHASAGASYVFGPNMGTLSGDASFGSLAIGGALVGRTLTFKGDAHANTVLFHSATVTITLDKQVVTGFYPPAPPGTPIAAGPGSRITTDALDIQFTNAKLFGQTLNGSIDIGQASATLWPVLHPFA